MAEILEFAFDICTGFIHHRPMQCKFFEHQVAAGALARQSSHSEKLQPLVEGSQLSLSENCSFEISCAFAAYCPKIPFGLHHSMLTMNVRMKTALFHQVTLDPECSSATTDDLSKVLKELTRSINRDDLYYHKTNKNCTIEFICQFRNCKLAGVQSESCLRLSC